ncbi:hypothetical protein HQQ80_13895 [Microbacteriaceae bacterium VKM Ac-2855]|nr:hypothetical protein [Microbacteriaceae bacterium VKM Ac-2855]
MQNILRSWAAFAALGAGLIHLALGAGSGGVLTVVLVVVGTVELLWAVLVLARGRVLAARTSIGVALALVAGWIGVILTTGGLDISPLPMLAAVVFDLAVAGIVTAQLRSKPNRTDPELPAGRMLLATFAGALLVASLATPALAATPASGGGGGDMGGMQMSVPSGHQHG